MDVKTFFVTFGLVFLAELGDKSRMSTICATVTNPLTHLTSSRLREDAWAGAKHARLSSGAGRCAGRVAAQVAVVSRSEGDGRPARPRPGAPRS